MVLNPDNNHTHKIILRSQVKIFLQEYFMEDDELQDTTLLVEHLGADSLDLLQVVYSLNDIFSIEIGVDTLPKMLTVGGACDLVVTLSEK